MKTNRKDTYYFHLAFLIFLLTFVFENLLFDRHAEKQTLFMNAINNKNIDHLNFLLKEKSSLLDIDNGDKNGKSALMYAAQIGNIPILLMLIEAGAGLEFTTKGDKATALHLASFNGHTEVVRELVQAGSNIDAITKDGHTALIIAVVQGHVELTKYLLNETSIRRNVRNKYGLTAYSYASMRGKENIKALFN